MTNTSRISISLPREMLRTADRARRALGESRSEFIRRAIENLLQQRHAQAVERYVAGYNTDRETETEVNQAHEWAREAFDKTAREAW